MPNSWKGRESKFDNEEYRSRDFVISLLLENKFVFNVEECIDDINCIYFEDMIN
ncbi:hypothetical protein [Clostridium sp.]|uniref:hypothetical protein n=1 Tax=Clostridium sp. TaxID=1506 RepID=UPI00260FFA48|nr:hypothetical protein [Clostridium sp.]